MTLSSQEIEVITEEKQILAKTYESLISQQSENSTKYIVEKHRARELTVQLVSTRRPEDKAQLASDEAVSHQLRDMKGSDSTVLESLLDCPYFARVVLEENSNGKPRKIEYKIGHHANPDCRIIDWRKAPLSKLYYEYQEGDDYAEEIQKQYREGKVLLRNTVEADRDVLKSLVSSKGAFRYEGNEWKKIAEANSRARLGSSSNELPSILSLITAEQFRTITEEASTAVIIQGIAGSGKTTVALHRLAWLLHKDNSDLNNDQAVVIVKNNSLRTYISQTLPSMRVNGVNILTYNEWALGHLNSISNMFGLPPYTIKQRSSPSSIIRLKNSIALLKTIEDYLEAAIDQLVYQIEKDIPWSDIPSGIKSVFDSLKNSSAILAPLSLLLTLRNSIEEAIRKTPPTHPKSSGLGVALNFITSTIKEQCNFAETLKAVCKDPKRILSNDETRLLDTELIVNYLKEFEESITNNQLMPGDEAILLRIAQMKLGGFIGPDGKPLRYGHIVLDEAQDFSAIHYALIMNSVTSPSQLTIVGDTAQSLDPDSTFPGWDKLRAYWGITEEESLRFVTLKVSHRSTLPIMKLADHVLGESRTDSGRPGKPPRWIKCNSDKDALPPLIEWLNEVRKRFPTSLTAIITSTRDEAREALSMLRPTFENGIRLCDSDAFTFESGIVISDIKSLKGLEFNSVLLWNPSSRGYPETTQGRNALYTAITRAETFLFLATWDSPSKLLPSNNSQLIRGEDYTKAG